jgi:hypothetical protein
MDLSMDVDIHPLPSLATYSTQHTLSIASTSFLKIQFIETASPHMASCVSSDVAEDFSTDTTDSCTINPACVPL